MSKLMLATSFLVFCGSCSRGFEIDPSGFGTNIRLAFPEGGLLSSPMVPCVTRLTVAQEQWPSVSRESPVWQIQASAGCVKLTGVDVGRIPDGFVQTINRLPLKVGGLYRASAEAKPYQGMSRPWFVCREAPEKARWENDQRLAAPPATCGR